MNRATIRAAKIDPKSLGTGVLRLVSEGECRLCMYPEGDTGLWNLNWRNGLFSFDEAIRLSVETMRQRAQAILAAADRLEGAIKDG